MYQKYFLYMCHCMHWTRSFPEHCHSSDIT